MPDSTPVSSMVVSDGEFTVAESTPDALRLTLDPLDCRTAAVSAAAARRPPKTKVKVSGSKRGGHGNITFGKAKPKKKNLTSERTKYTFTETCRGATIKVTEGAVRLDFVSRSGRSLTRRVTAGRSYFIQS